MLNSFIRKIKLAFGDPEIRFRILFLAGALAVFRLLAAVPIPGVDRAALASFFASNQFFGLLNIFSGGGLSRLSGRDARRWSLYHRIDYYAARHYYFSSTQRSLF